MSVLKAASDTEVANMKKHKKLKKELEEMCVQEGLVLTAGSTTHNNNSSLTFHYNCTQTTQTFTYITNSTDPIPSLVQSFVSAGDIPSPTNSSYSRANAPLQPIDTSSKCPSQCPSQFPAAGGEGQIPHSLNAIEDRQSFSKSSVVATESLASSTSQGSTACETLQSETAALGIIYYILCCMLYILYCILYYALYRVCRRAQDATERREGCKGETSCSS